MHPQSTAFVLATLFAALHAYVPQPKPSDHICAHEKTAVVNFEWWVNGNTHCRNDGTSIHHPIHDIAGSQQGIIDQEYCYDITPASSYKVWQEESVGSAVVCKFAVYPKYECKGKPIETSRISAKHSNATCVACTTGSGAEPDNNWYPSYEYGLYPFRGSKSVKLSCKCQRPKKSSRKSKAKVN